ncbi:hypothetical protein N7493_005257 [Penicillium malachiteum]|uniref:Uncharacterized protein n=1 Tax=Penicillium malachiteum TaxID=1324776 RepID=A0AAD6MWN8_9EURO|nr:hypothetical protein N7493_005257 [Penicillium malachiteum]
MRYSFDYTKPDFRWEDKTGQFSPDSTKFAFTSCNGIVRLLMAASDEVRILNIDSGGKGEKLPISFGDSISLRLSASGNLLASVSAPLRWDSYRSGSSSNIQVWDLITGHLLTVLNDHNMNVNVVVFSSGGMLASALLTTPFASGI